MKIVVEIAVATWFVVPALVVAEEESRINNEAEIRLTIEATHEYASDLCKASMELEYYQKGASAHVETTLANEQCDASFGSYALEIRYRDGAGNVLTKEVAETWERSDASPVEMVKDYFVADDIDIIRVRSRKLRCTCASKDSETDD